MPKAKTEEAVDPALAREKEKERLIKEVVVLKAQKAAVTTAIEDRQARLKVLMAEDGNSHRKTTHGEASFYKFPSYHIKSMAALKRLFSKDVLAEIAKPNKAFFTAAESKLGAQTVSKAITVAYDERFKVEGLKDKKSRELREQHIAESRAVVEQKVQQFMERM